MTQHPTNPPGFGNAPGAAPQAYAGHNPYAQYDLSGGGGGYDDGEQKNTIGLVGFIVSLASIISCCSLAPIGLLLSFIGLFKAPRGFAIAGTVIGAVFSLIFLLGVVGVVAMWSMIEQGALVGAAEIQVQSFVSNNGRLPDAAEYDAILQSANQGLPGFIQPQFPFAYEYVVIDDSTYEVTLAGFDGRLHTGDDVPQTYTVFVPPSPAAPAPAP